MGQLLLLVVVALTVAAVVFGVTVLVSGGDPGLAPAEPDGRAVPLPGDRPLGEEDVSRVRFDTALRGYRMAQVDQALRRAAYDIGYKDELIGVLQSEVTALRDGRTADADALRRAREAALAPTVVAATIGAPPAPGTGTGRPADTGPPVGADAVRASVDVGANGASVEADAAGPPAEVGAVRAPMGSDAVTGPPAEVGAAGPPVDAAVGPPGDQHRASGVPTVAGDRSARADEVGADRR
jgi:DivIVA domain-containing protein